MSENYNSKLYKSSCSAYLIKEILKAFGHIDGVVLDAGCGPGYPTRILQQNCNNIIGIDVSNASSNAAFMFDKSVLSDTLTFLSGDATKLPFKNKSFDAVVSFDVIEHIQDDLAYMTEIRRVMKSGAKLILETPNKDRLSNKLSGFFNPIEYPLMLGDGCIHVREYSKNTLTDLLKAAGFQAVKVKGPWLGLRGKVELGLHKFPKYLEKYSQYWFVEAIA